MAHAYLIENLRDLAHSGFSFSSMATHVGSSTPDNLRLLLTVT